jgi:hypothetical protein
LKMEEEGDENRKKEREEKKKKKKQRRKGRKREDRVATERAQRVVWLQLTRSHSVSFCVHR